MKILKNGCDVVRRRDAADEPGSNILYTLKFCQIFVWLLENYLSQCRILCYNTFNLF